MFQVLCWNGDDSPGVEQWFEVRLGRVALSGFLLRRGGRLPTSQCRRVLDFTNVRGCPFEVTLLRRWHVGISLDRYAAGEHLG